MNISEILRKIPEDKLYKNPKIKEDLSATKLRIIKKLDDIINQKKKNNLAKDSDLF